MTANLCERGATKINTPFRSGDWFEAQAHEFHLRGHNRLVNVVGADADVDPAGGLLFGFTNRRHDAIVVHML